VHRTVGGVSYALMLDSMLKSLEHGLRSYSALIQDSQCLDPGHGAQVAMCTISGSLAGTGIVNGGL
jgi:hypothetical protein